MSFVQTGGLSMQGILIETFNVRIYVYVVFDFKYKFI